MSQFLRHKCHNRDTGIPQSNSPLNSGHFESIRHTKRPHTPSEPMGHTSTSARPQSHMILSATRVVQYRHTTIPLDTNCLAPHAPHMPRRPRPSLSLGNSARSIAPLTTPDDTPSLFISSGLLFPFPLSRLTHPDLY